MENEIKVGEFIRTKDGRIYQVDSSNDEWALSDIFYKVIVKHSSNLIDLIQCGDYVNGIKIISIIQQADTMKTIFLCGFDNDYLDIKLKNRDIKTVVTKEQFESISYKVTKM